LTVPDIEVRYGITLRRIDAGRLVIL